MTHGHLPQQLWGLLRNAHSSRPERAPRRHELRLAGLCSVVLSLQVCNPRASGLGFLLGVHRCGAWGLQGIWGVWVSRRRCSCLPCFPSNCAQPMNFSFCLVFRELKPVPGFRNHSRCVTRLLVHCGYLQPPPDLLSSMLSH